MGDLRLAHYETNSGVTGKIIAAVIVALAIGAVGLYAYDEGMWRAPVVSDDNLPSPGPVLNVPAKAPPQPR